VLSPSELAEALVSPYALERFSVLTGEPVCVVDLRDRPNAPGGPRNDEIRRALAWLPCPTIAVVGEGHFGSAEGSLAAGGSLPAEGSLVGAFDVVVADEAGLAPMLATIAAAPLASLALVQLLRQGAHLPLHEALIAESLVYSTLQAGPEFAAWLGSASKPSRALARDGPPVRVERFDSQLVLSLNRPERHNAFSVEIRDALVEGLQMAIADDSIDEVMLRGEGPSFSSGGDLSEFGDLPDPATAHAVRSTRNPGRLLAACAPRVVTRVHGACIGAGVELPAFGHRVVAAESSFFQLPELSMGLVPGAGGTASLPRRIGRQRTCWLALSGARLDAPTAHRWGLVDEIW
jgi:enoyl-CoA hydratase